MNLQKSLMLSSLFSSIKINNQRRRLKAHNKMARAKKQVKTTTYETPLVSQKNKYDAPKYAPDGNFGKFS